MLNSNRKISKSVSGFAVSLGALAGLMASFNATKHKIPSGFTNNLADAVMWSGIFLIIIFVCKCFLQRFKFFSAFYGPVDTKSALAGAVVCVLVYLLMIFLTVNLL
jgi:ABC-type xylose transport system permease subunit